MRKSRLFNRTRFKLAASYAGVMGLILSVCGVAVYFHLAQTHFSAIDGEIQTLAGTLHDSLEPMLEQPGQLNAKVKQILPGICINTTACTAPISTSHTHVLGVDSQDPYYIRFLDKSSQILATVNTPPQNNPSAQGESWQTIVDPQGQRYHQFSLLLKTSTGQPWGYLQVGRSLSSYDDHLESLKVFLLLGLPIAMLSIGGASWWLAGLAMQPVYDSYQRVQQFTADAAHELRTPLAAIQATVESTLDVEDLTLPEAQTTLQTIERQNRRLSQLVQDLLMLSRMDLKVLPMKQQSCCLNDLVCDLVEELAALAISAQVSLELKVLANHPLYVTGDEEKLYRLIANLITNAIQYSLPKGTVVVRLLEKEHDALIQVQDTGIGIAPNERDRIFDRFYRVNADRSRQTGGAGLGLAIAQAIVKAHHGSIQVQSQLSRGSTFTVRLPLQNMRHVPVQMKSL
ncbi:two-component sensor histidine kinase (plasmid) [Leptolyngbya sp. NIES-3755]|nr:two-component sensor histidine kinase [Leptolyngbya sp. NIES-3755]